MKSFLFVLTAWLAGAGPVAAQFTGKLVYTNGDPDYPLTITFWQNKNLGRVTQSEIEIGDDNKPDRAHPKISDTLAYDFAAGTVTGWQTKRQWAVTALSKHEMDVISSHITDGVATLTKVGVEKLNGYTCTHWHWTVRSKKPGFDHDEDLWITRDLGVPGLLILGNTAYYTAEHPLVKKLIAAGGMGVLVKRGNHKIGRTGYELKQVDLTPPPPQTFRAPASYERVDATKFPS